MSMNSGDKIKMARMQFLVGLNESNDNCNDISIKECNEIKQLGYDNDSIENNPTRVVEFVNDEVLYQNNMEMALNSLNKISAQTNVNSINCDDASGISSSNSSNTDSNNISINNIPTSSTCSKHPKMIGNGDDNQVTNLRHRRSVEITAMTSVTTGIDGVPVISFSFHQTNDNAELSKDIPDENIDINDKNGENSVVELELYDFPKNSRPTSVGDYITRSNREEEEEEGAVVIVKNKTTSLSSPVLNHSLNDIDKANDHQKYLNNLYDFPRSHRLSLLNKPDAIEHERIDSEMFNSNELKINNECHYEMLNRSGSLKLSKSDDCGLNLTVGNLHLDSECSESRERPKKYRLGKAWGKMRSWLREERTKLNEVVQRHARLQAVGVGCHSESNTDDDSMSSGRCGSYDLVAARAKELGIKSPQIHDNEFVLESVSEEIHLSQHDEVVVSHDLATSTTQTSILASAVTTTIANTTALKRDSLECPTYDDEKVGKKLPEIINGGRLRKRIASSDNILCGTKLKLAPVSISLDKLCDDNVGDCNNDNDDDDDDDDDNGIVMKNKNKDLCEIKTIGEKELQKTHMGKGGLIKRRMLGSIRGLMASTNLLHQHENEEMKVNDANRNIKVVDGK
ncbi:hypothetical protein PV326_003540 [Microctonus aethiopoides]|nr:hypothetical protein PV326_003540 [Microctonus aethiopoides]